MVITVTIIGVFPVNWLFRWVIGHRSSDPIPGLPPGWQIWGSLLRNHGDWSSHGDQMRIWHMIDMYIYIYIYLFIYGIYSYDNVVAGCRCHVLGWSWMDWYFSVVCTISLTNSFTQTHYIPFLVTHMARHLDIWIYHQSYIYTYKSIYPSIYLPIYLPIYLSNLI